MKKNSTTKLLDELLRIHTQAVMSKMGKALLEPNVQEFWFKKKEPDCNVS